MDNREIYILGVGISLFNELDLFKGLLQDGFQPFNWLLEREVVISTSTWFISLATISNNLFDKVSQSVYCIMARITLSIFSMACLSSNFDLSAWARIAAK